MKDGDAGSIRGMGAAADVPKAGCRERPFRFRGFLGEGEVIGLKTGFTSEGFDAMVNGMRWTGESGDDDGDGSVSGDESVVEKVVVGDESADSEA
jgi:hypothetical protein